MATRYNIPKLQAAMAGKGYRWFNDMPYHLNLVGIRRANAVPNSFDDAFTVGYNDGKTWRYAEWKCTTDPGLHWLKSPMNAKGTAILKPGQYLDCWQVGMHQGAYRALVQRGPVTVIRDFDRDATLDFNAGREETGIFGINIHRANAARESVQVDKWSAGCTVIANPISFNALMALANESVRMGRTTFSYTLLNEADLEK